jgi:gamma-glutamylcyclotransferase
MGHVLYFAYGSNLNGAQMRSRCRGARRVGRAVLPNHALAFGGFSCRWGGAVASVVRARGERVEGLLYELDDADVRRLDGFEGHPFAYVRVVRFVVAEDGRRRRVVTYVQREEALSPSSPPRGYLGVLRRAYGRLGFDVGHLALAAGVRP